MFGLNIQTAAAVVWPSRELAIDDGTADVFQVIRAPGGKHKTELGFELPATQQELQVMLFGVSHAQAQFLSIEAARFFTEETERKRMTGVIAETDIKAFVCETDLVVCPVMLIAKAERAKFAGLLKDYVVWDYLSDYDRWYLVPRAERPTLIISEPEVVYHPADEEKGKKAIVAVTVHYEMRPGGTITELWDTTGPHWKTVSPEEVQAAAAAEEALRA